jgi:hypothetical protein
MSNKAIVSGSGSKLQRVSLCTKCVSFVPKRITNYNRKHNNIILTTIMQPITTIQPQAEISKPDTSHRNWLTDEQKMEAIESVADMLMKGERSTGSVQDLLAKLMPEGKCSRNTAIKYRNAAMKLLERESKPMNRENLRNLEIGRLHLVIERTYNTIDEFESSKPSSTDDDWLKWHETWAKLMSKLNDAGARLHAITGLNEITINNTDDRKRILFIRPGEQVAKPIGHMSSPQPDTHVPSSQAETTTSESE